MRHAIETRSALPIETRSEEDNPIAAATAAVEELRTAVEQNRTNTEQRITTELRSLTERLDALDVRTQRPGGGQERQGETPVEVRAFEGYVRQGREALQAEEVRALRVADDRAGGYLAPDQFTTELLRDLVQFSPVRSAARVGTMSSGAIILPKRTARVAARWVSEIEERPKSEPAYGQVEIPANEMAVYVDVSNALLEDAAVDIAAELSYDFGEEFGRLEGEAFVLGDGNKKPVGVLADPAVPVVLNGHAANLQPDALVSIMYALPAFYRNRGSWMMNGPTIGRVRLLKDTAGRFLWQDSLTEGEPPTLLGRPVIEAVDMPDVAAGATPIAFGDFASGYRIYDRVGLSVLRDPYTIAVYGQTRFHARRRVGAGVVRPEAIRKLKIATA